MKAEAVISVRTCTDLKFGPNIKDWPEMPALTDDLLVKVCSYITDPVTTTDELIPSGETSSYRSNPERLSEFALSRRAPQYVSRSKVMRQMERDRRAGKGLAEEVKAVYATLTAAGVKNDPENTDLGSAIFANMPGDGSAREQAASCQRVMGASANFAKAYATKRYRSNCINWGMTPFRNEIFATLEKVVDRLCDTICTLSNQVISSITGRQWIIELFN